MWRELFRRTVLRRSGGCVMSERHVESSMAGLPVVAWSAAAPNNVCCVCLQRAYRRLPPLVSAGGLEGEGPQGQGK